MSMKGVIPYITLLFIGILLFPSAGNDDVYITYWAAESLSERGEIVNYNGEHVEQSSSLLHVVVLAAVHRLSGGEMVIIGTVLSVLFGAITIFLTGKLAIRDGQTPFLARMMVATAVPVLYWSFGALETTLVCACVLGVLIAVINGSHSWCAVALTCYLLVRPEAFFIMALFLVILTMMFLWTGKPIQPVVVHFVGTLILFGVIVSIRAEYFNDIFPQPVRAKVGTSIFADLYSGAAYYGKALREYPPFIILVIPVLVYAVQLLRKRINDKTVMVVVAFIVAYGAFVLFSGGDWMEGGRFFAPIVAPAVVLLTRLINSKTTVAWGMIVLNLGALFYFAHSFSTSIPMFAHAETVAHYGVDTAGFPPIETVNRIHYRDVAAAAELTTIVDKTVNAGIEPVILSTQAGMIAYYLFQDFYGQARFVDLFALSTRDFTDCEQTNSVPKNRFGIALEFETVLTNMETLQTMCDIPTPDIIYGLDWQELVRVKAVEKHGYTTVYLQTGQLINQGWLTGVSVRGFQFIAVKDELVSRLSLEATQFTFD